MFSLILSKFIAKCVYRMLSGFSEIIKLKCVGDNVNNDLKRTCSSINTEFAKISKQWLFGILFSISTMTDSLLVTNAILLLFLSSKNPNPIVRIHSLQFAIHFKHFLSLVRCDGASHISHYNFPFIRTSFTRYIDAGNDHFHWIDFFFLGTHRSNDGWLFWYGSRSFCVKISIHTLHCSSS